MQTLEDIFQMRTLHIPKWTTGDRMRKSREDLGLSQQEFADVSGISVASIRGYETDVRLPRPIYMRVWSQLTGVPVEWLLTGEVPADMQKPLAEEGFEDFDRRALRDSNPRPSDP